MKTPAVVRRTPMKMKVSNLMAKVVAKIEVILERLQMTKQRKTIATGRAA